MGPMTRVSDLIRAKGRHVHTIDHAATVAAAGQEFLEKGIGSLLVVEGDRVAGIFTKNDLVRALMAGSPPGDPVSKSMSTDLFVVEPDAALEDVFQEMLRRGLRHVPVMAEHRLIGVITPIDVLVHQKDAAGFENSELMRYIQGTY